MVYDNNGKDIDACKPLIDAFKVVTHLAAPHALHLRQRSLHTRLQQGINKPPLHARMLQQ